MFAGAFLKTGVLSDSNQDLVYYFIVIINWIFFINWIYYFFSVLNISWKDILTNFRRFKCVREFFEEDRKKEEKIRKRLEK